MSYSNPSYQAKTAKENQILRKGLSFTNWSMILEGALLKENVLGHVFHNIDWVTPQRPPIRSQQTADPLGDMAAQAAQHTGNEAYRAFMEKDTIAFGIIMQRLDESLRPDFGIATRPLAKVLYDTVAATYRPVVTVDIHKAIDSLHNVRLQGSNTLKYCEDFQQKLLNFKNAVDQHCRAYFCSKERVDLPDIYINILFEKGTLTAEWLRSWRHNFRPEKATLEEMITSIRREQQPSGTWTPAKSIQFRANAAPSQALDDDERCQLCSHDHTNARCYRQHPDRAPPRKGKGKDHDKGKKKSDLSHRKKPEKSRKHKSAAAVGSDSDTSHNVHETDDSTGMSTLAISAAAKSQGLSSTTTVIDSGTSFHFFNNISWFKDLRPMKHSFSQAVGTAKISQGGTVCMKIVYKGKTTVLKLKDCLYSPKSHVNLISLGRLKALGGLDFDVKTGTLTKDSKPIGYTKDYCYVSLLQDFKIMKAKHEGLKMPLQGHNPTAPAVISAPAVAKPKADTYRWHQRLGHVGNQIMNATKQATIGMEDIDTSTLHHCEACKLSKSQRVVSRVHRAIPLRCMAEIHVDTVGPVLPEGINGSRYIMIFTDARTRSRTPYFLTNKHGPQVVKQHVAFISNKWDVRPKLIFSDGGGEFINNELKQFATAEGIRWDISSPETPEQNGIAESSNKVILGKARTMMVDSSVPAHLWPFAVAYSAHITDRLTNLTTKKVPLQQAEEELNGTADCKLDLSHLRRFGCRAYRHIQDQPKSWKFAPRADPCWFVGFQENSSTNYKLWKPILDNTGRWIDHIWHTPHVTFYEDFVFKDQFLYSQHQSPPFHVQGELQGHEDHVMNTQEMEEVPQEPTHTGFSEVQQNNQQQAKEAHQQPADATSLGEQTETEVPLPNTLPQDAVLDEGEPHQAEPHHDIVHNEVEHNHDQGEPDHGDTPMTPFNVQDTTGKRKRNSSLLASDQPPPEKRTTRSGRPMHTNYKQLHNTGAAAVMEKDPLNLKEVLKSPNAPYWLKAMATEVNSLLATGTVKWIKRSTVPRSRRLLTAKWVFKTKRNPDQSVEKHKARWTARGFTQRHGTDYSETFAPTPRAATGRILLALAIQFDWIRTQIDVETAFLNPELDTTLYIEPPEGYELLGLPKYSKKEWCILLGKGLYGLKQSAHLWYHHVSDTMVEMGMERLKSDACVFTSKGIIVIMHVDDFQIFSVTQKRADWFLQGLKKKYKIKTVTTDLFLGIHIKPMKDGKVLLSQEHYSVEKLTRHHLLEAKTAKYPLERLYEPSSNPCSKEQYHLFNKIIGELQHLANNTRPDINFAVNHLARFLQNPSDEHIQGAKHIWRYINGTKSKGILLGKVKTLEMKAYSDSDFAGDPSTTRSCSGSLILLGDSVVHWRSQLQKSVVLSSTEAEYLALTETCREIAWVRNLLNELQSYTAIKFRQVKVLVDNQSAISLVRNHTNSKRSRHVSLRNHYCREQHHKGKIIVEWVETKHQLADALTKPKSPNEII